MKFNFKPSPNYRDTISTQTIMRDLLLGLLTIFLFAIGYYYYAYGIDYAAHIVILFIAASAAGLITEALWFQISKKKIKQELSKSFPLITSTILVLTCPIQTTIYAVVIGTIAAITLGKLVFGGFGQNIFNPAGVGRAIILASFSSATIIDLQTSATPTKLYAAGGWLSESSAAFSTFLHEYGGMSNLFLGIYPGAIGETSALLLVIVAIFLIYRKVIDYRITLTYILTLFGLALFLGIIEHQSLLYPFFHILTGGALFGAVFMLTDPVTSPTSITGKIIFAMGAAILTFVIRIKANLPEGVLISILFMNMMTPLIERMCDRHQIKAIKKNYQSIIWLTIVAIIITIALSIVAKPLPIDYEKKYEETKITTSYQMIQEDIV